MQLGDHRETQRLRALERLDLLDSAPDAELDELAVLAAALFRMPVALITITAEKRNWFKAKFGTDLCESPREISFCTWAIRRDDLFEVPDLSADPRFRDNPLVAGPLHVRYYAGLPILIDGFAIGTLCLHDFVARRPLNEAERLDMARLVALAATLIRVRVLRRANAGAGAITDATTDAVVCFDKEGVVTRWNPAASALFGFAASEALRRPLTMFLPERLRAPMTNNRLTFLETGERHMIGRTVEIAILHRDGREIPVELSLATWTEDGGEIGFGAIVRDITERRRIEDERAEARRFADTIVENLPATLFVKAADTRAYMAFNRAGEELTGVSADAVIGRTDAEIWPDVAEADNRRDDRVLESGVSDVHESEFLRPDGRTRIVRTRRVAVRDADGAPLYLLGIGEDVTDWRQAQRQLAHAAGHDALTGLYNRENFMWTVDAALAEAAALAPAASGPAEVALLALDLDRFSAIVGAYGRTASDELLVDVAARIRAVLKPNSGAARFDAARFDADRFFVVVQGAGAGQRAEALAREILTSIAIRDGDGPQARARIGIAVAPRDGDTAESLAASAELAALRAKGVAPDRASSGGWRVAFFERAQDDAAKRRRRVEERLAIAIANGCIDVHYQPLVELAGGRISGFEALARWNDAELGEVSPVEFIPVAEANGLVSQLGAGVLAKAAREAAGWSSGLSLAVNFSAAQFADDRLADGVAAALDAAGLDPHRLEIEITESLLIAPHERVLDTLRRLKAAGSTVAMDDFGTGYSSLGYFCSFPFDKVKIDQSFVRDMTTSREARAIVRAVVGLAHGLGMKVAGEGVETAAQMEALASDGCDLGQGFLIGRPAAAATWATATRMQSPVHRRAAAR